MERFASTRGGPAYTYVGDDTRLSSDPAPELHAAYDRDKSPFTMSGSLHGSECNNFNAMVGPFGTPAGSIYEQPHTRESHSSGHVPTTQESSMPVTFPFERSSNEHAPPIVVAPVSLRQPSAHPTGHSDPARSVPFVLSSGDGDLSDSDVSDDTSDVSESSSSSDGEFAGLPGATDTEDGSTYRGKGRRESSHSAASSFGPGDLTAMGITPICEAEVADQRNTLKYDFPPQSRAERKERRAAGRAGRDADRKARRTACLQSGERALALASDLLESDMRVLGSSARPPPLAVVVAQAVGLMLGDTSMVWAHYAKLLLRPDFCHRLQMLDPNAVPFHASRRARKHLRAHRLAPFHLRPERTWDHSAGGAAHQAAGGTVPSTRREHGPHGSTVAAPTAAADVLLGEVLTHEELAFAAGAVVRATDSLKGQRSAAVAALLKWVLAMDWYQTARRRFAVKRDRHRCHRRDKRRHRHCRNEQRNIRIAEASKYRSAKRRDVLAAHGTSGLETHGDSEHFYPPIATTQPPLDPTLLHQSRPRNTFEVVAPDASYRFCPTSGPKPRTSLQFAAADGLDGPLHTQARAEVFAMSHVRRRHGTKLATPMMDSPEILAYAAKGQAPCYLCGADVPIPNLRHHTGHCRNKRRAAIAAARNRKVGAVDLSMPEPPVTPVPVLSTSPKDLWAYAVEAKAIFNTVPNPPCPPSVLRRPRTEAARFAHLAAKAAKGPAAPPVTFDVEGEVAYPRPADAVHRYRAFWDAVYAKRRAAFLQQLAVQSSVSDPSRWWQQWEEAFDASEDAIVPPRVWNEVFERSCRGEVL